MIRKAPMPHFRCLTQLTSRTRLHPGVPGGVSLGATPGSGYRLWDLCDKAGLHSGDCQLCVVIEPLAAMQRHHSYDISRTLNHIRVYPAKVRKSQAAIFVKLYSRAHGAF